MENGLMIKPDGKAQASQEKRDLLIVLMGTLFFFSTFSCVIGPILGLKPSLTDVVDCLYALILAGFSGILAGMLRLLWNVSLNDWHNFSSKRKSEGFVIFLFNILSLCVAFVYTFFGEIASLHIFGDVLKDIVQDYVYITMTAYFSGAVALLWDIQYLFDHTPSDSIECSHKKEEEEEIEIKNHGFLSAFLSAWRKPVSKEEIGQCTIWCRIVIALKIVMFICIFLLLILWATSLGIKYMGRFFMDYPIWLILFVSVFIICGAAVCIMDAIYESRNIIDNREYPKKTPLIKHSIKRELN